jgi:hypothetical protein
VLISKIATSNLKTPLFTTNNQAFSVHLAGFWLYLGSILVSGLNPDTSFIASYLSDLCT